MSFIVLTHSLSLLYRRKKWDSKRFGSLPSDRGLDSRAGFKSTSIRCWMEEYSFVTFYQVFLLWKQKGQFPLHSLPTRHWVKCSVDIIFFNPHNNLWGGLLFPFNRGGTEEEEALVVWLLGQGPEGSTWQSWDTHRVFLTPGPALALAGLDRVLTVLQASAEPFKGTQALESDLPLRSCVTFSK